MAMHGRDEESEFVVIENDGEWLSASDGGGAQVFAPPFLVPGEAHEPEAIVADATHLGELENMPEETPPDAPLSYTTEGEPSWLQPQEATLEPEEAALLALEEREAADASIMQDAPPAAPAFKVRVSRPRLVPLAGAIFAFLAALVVALPRGPTCGSCSTALVLDEGATLTAVSYYDTTFLVKYPEAFVREPEAFLSAHVKASTVWASPRYWVGPAEAATRCACE